MRIEQDAREAADDGQMERLDDETDIESSPAAEVNCPPVGEHDASAVPELPEFVDYPHPEHEEPADD